jgi:hypothetical protein
MIDFRVYIVDYCSFYLLLSILLLDIDLNIL